MFYLFYGPLPSFPSFFQLSLHHSVPSCRPSFPFFSIIAILSFLFLLCLFSSSCSLSPCSISFTVLSLHFLLSFSFFHCCIPSSCPAFPFLSIIALLYSLPFSACCRRAPYHPVRSLLWSSPLISSFLSLFSHQSLSFLFLCAFLSSCSCYLHHLPFFMLLFLLCLLLSPSSSSWPFFLPFLYPLFFILLRLLPSFPFLHAPIPFFFCFFFSSLFIMAFLCSLSLPSVLHPASSCTFLFTFCWPCLSLRLPPIVSLFSMAFLSSLSIPTFLCRSQSYTFLFSLSLSPFPTISIVSLSFRPFLSFFLLLFNRQSPSFFLFAFSGHLSLP